MRYRVGAEQLQRVPSLAHRPDGCSGWPGPLPLGQPRRVRADQRPRRWDLGRGTRGVALLVAVSGFIGLLAGRGGAALALDVLVDPGRVAVRRAPGAGGGVAAHRGPRRRHPNLVCAVSGAARYGPVRHRACHGGRLSPRRILGILLRPARDLQTVPRSAGNGVQAPCTLLVSHRCSGARALQCRMQVARTASVCTRSSWLGCPSPGDFQGDADVVWPVPHAFGEEPLAVVGLLDGDVVQLAEQLERHGAKQRRPGHQVRLEQRVGRVRRDQGADQPAVAPVSPERAGSILTASREGRSLFRWLPLSVTAERGGRHGRRTDRAVP